MLQEESGFTDFQLIMELMNDQNFRTLFDRQFDDFSNIKSVLVIMKTYAYLEQLYIQEYGYKPSKEYMGKGIQKLMRNQNTRSFLVESTREFLNDKESFDNIVKQNIRHLDLLTDKK
jgi:predicted nucleic-acid-binding protein